jgi:hypothetical protein
MIEQGLLDIQDLRDFLTLCSLMKNNFTSLKNLRNITCYLRKMNQITLVRTKITSLGSCVCVRPRFRNGECIFDGKIGCFPLATYENAIGGSRNRLHGEQVMKPITSITRDVIRDFTVNKVLPAIQAKWLREDVDKPIFIQQDNAPTHLYVNGPIFCEAAKEEGLTFT